MKTLRLNSDRIEARIFYSYEQMSIYLEQFWVNLSDSILNDGKSFSVALSGGNTPLRFYRKMAATLGHYRAHRTHVFLVDERCVPVSHKKSNTRHIQENFIGPAGIPENQFYRVNTGMPLVEDSARLYERTIHNCSCFAESPPDFPVFDLILLGIGSDGHTASLFPETSCLETDSRLVVAVQKQNESFPRISFALNLINRAKNIVFLISGGDKAGISQKVIIERDMRYPASRVQPVKGRLQFLLDKSADDGLMSD